MDQLESSSNFLVYLKTTWVWPGVVEVGQFLGTHLISGMIPAFLIAGAIAVLIDKERITRYFGPKASPLISFPVAALSGAILTVCSCGVIPIFTGILTRGAGVGPAFTFLFSAPAINLIAVTYTFTYMGTKVAIGRIMAVILCAIGLGIVMKTFFPDKSEITNCQVMAAEEDSERTDLQTGSFFFLLLFFMLTSTGFFDPIIQSIIPEIAASYLNIIRG
ncbi:permease [bacterium]|nr:permease [bacterium]